MTWKTFGKNALKALKIAALVLVKGHEIGAIKLKGSEVEILTRGAAELDKYDG